MADLYYVIGASGAGKDSVLNFARRHLSGTAPVIFCHRYITRPANAGGENHIELTKQEFLNRLRHDCFVMHWQSHGHQYGIGVEITSWLQSGMSVVINGSRQYLDQAADIFPDLIPVHIVVSHDVLADRLRGRGRESAEDIARRIDRARLLEEIYHHNVAVIDNNGCLEVAGHALIDLITKRLRLAGENNG